MARSSHEALSHTDSFATSSADALLLIGRILVGVLFLTSGWSKLMNTAGAISYLTSVKAPAPELMVWVVLAVKLVVGITLIVGLPTRYGALLGFIFVVIATALAHRYWEYPAAFQVAQYINFTKNIAILGGLLYVFVAGAGRFSVDAALAQAR
jgi:putative oxidoreductase